jgi:dienelactone hydrolase
MTKRILALLAFTLCTGLVTAAAPADIDAQLFAMGGRPHDVAARGADLSGLTQATAERAVTAEGLPLDVLRIEASRGTVILAHGCSGPTPARDGVWAGQLAQAGFATVAFDSWAWRGIPGGVCQTSAVNGEQRTAEVKLVVAWLQRQPWHRGRIFLLGWSHGGITALASSVQGLGLARAVAMYPWCERHFANPVIPVQIHIGTADDWTPASRCAGLYTVLWGRSLGTMHLYDGAFHDFDRFELIDRRYIGLGERGELQPRRLKTDPAARTLAVERVIAFFRDAD